MTARPGRGHWHLALAQFQIVQFEIIVFGILSSL